MSKDITPNPDHGTCHPVQCIPGCDTCEEVHTCKKCKESYGLTNIRACAKCFSWNCKDC